MAKKGTFERVKPIPRATMRGFTVEVHLEAHKLYV